MPRGRQRAALEQGRVGGHRGPERLRHFLGSFFLYGDFVWRFYMAILYVAVREDHTEGLFSPETVRAKRTSEKVDAPYSTVVMLP